MSYTQMMYSVSTKIIKVSQRKEITLISQYTILMSPKLQGQPLSEDRGGISGCCSARLPVSSPTVSPPILPFVGRTLKIGAAVLSLVGSTPKSGLPYTLSYLIFILILIIYFIQKN
jgi:hypothetical protein